VGVSVCLSLFLPTIQINLKKDKGAGGGFPPSLSLLHNLRGQRSPHTVHRARDNTEISAYSTQGQRQYRDLHIQYTGPETIGTEISTYRIQGRDNTEISTYRIQGRDNTEIFAYST
jgi:hypothetical protein